MRNFTLYKAIFILFGNIYNKGLGKVVKGKKMPGRMGGENATTVEHCL
jgi:ribosomal protein L3